MHPRTCFNHLRTTKICPFCRFCKFFSPFRAKKMRQGEKIILCTPRVFRERSTSGTKIIAFAFCGWTNWIIELATDSQAPTDFLALVFVYKQRMAVGIPTAIRNLVLFASIECTRDSLLYGFFFLGGADFTFAQIQSSGEFESALLRIMQLGVCIDLRYIFTIYR